LSLAIYSQSAEYIKISTLSTCKKKNRRYNCPACYDKKKFALLILFYYI